MGAEMKHGREINIVYRESSVYPESLADNPVFIVYLARPNPSALVAAVAFCRYSIVVESSIKRESMVDGARQPDHSLGANRQYRSAKSLPAWLPAILEAPLPNPLLGFNIS